MNAYSACVTSVLRTYYTYKVVKEPDISYNIVLMGLWTLAEVATGVIVSCLPVLPRFFRHAGPTVYRVFSVKTKSSSSSGSAGAEAKARPSLTSPTNPLDRPHDMESMAKAQNDSCVHKAYVKGDPMELAGYDALLISKANAVHQLRPGPIRSNRDVESGGWGFPVRDT